jgi:hypothetical protein
MSIPLAGSGPNPGKPLADHPLRDWPDDDDSDVEILEAHSPKSLAFSLDPTSADMDDIPDAPPHASGGRKKWPGDKSVRPQQKKTLLRHTCPPHVYRVRLLSGIHLLLIFLVSLFLIFIFSIDID